MSQCRIIIVEARPVRRQRLSAMFSANRQIILVASCATLMEAYTRIEAEVPDLILISRRLTEAPEHSMLVALMRILGVRAIQTDDEQSDPELPRLVLAEAAADPRKSEPSTAARAAASPRDERSRARPGPVDPVSSGENDRAGLAPSRAAAPQPIILIGASTGGVEALHRLLPCFPANCPPVIVVQHIRGAFSSAFAERLNRICPAQVFEAQDGAPLAPGQIIVAPGDATHLHLVGRHPIQAKLVAGPAVSGHRPSVDALFTSALPFAGRVVAALLTGMGSDGAQGLLALRQAGAQTFAQDQATSTVYGMPRVAAELGAAARILPLASIGPTLLTAALEIAADRRLSSVDPR